MNDLASTRQSTRSRSPGPQISRHIQGDNQRDNLLVGQLLFISLTGSLAVVSAIFTTMIELGPVWRYSWLVACISLALLMVMGVFRAGSAISGE